MFYFKQVGTAPVFLPAHQAIPGPEGTAVLNLPFAPSPWLLAIALYNALLSCGKIRSFNQCSLRLTLWLKGYWLNSSLVLPVNQPFLSLPVFYSIRDFVGLSYCWRKGARAAIALSATDELLRGLPGVLFEESVFVNESALDLRLQISPKLSKHFGNFMCVVFHCKADLHRDNQK